MGELELIEQRGFQILPEYSELAQKISESLNLDSYIPQRSTSGSAGYDIRSIEDLVVPPHTVAMVGTGLTAYMKSNEELQIRSRSGLASKMIVVSNSPGTIDSDYYGKHIKVLIFNQTDEPFEIKAGDRIAQGVFSSYLTTDNDNPISKSRVGGFGSTGTK